MREGISDVIHEASGGRAAACAEVYVDPPLLEDFGFDGGLGDSKMGPTHSAKTCPSSPRAEAIGRGIETENALAIEWAMSGPGSVDDMNAQPYQGRPFRAAYMAPAVTASWLPGADLLVNEIDCTLGAGATYAPPDLPPMSLPNCFRRCEADAKCDAVRVDWWPVEKNWSARHIGCGLRGGVDQATCTRAPHHVK